jgi:cation:H+ antiporter
MAFYIISGVISLFIILASCEFFTNAIEWTGRKMDLNEGVTGSILAAIGTALPETLVPIIAVLFVPGHKGAEIGIGAILGAPFMLSTLAMGITGITVIVLHGAKKRPLELDVDGKILSNDLMFFVIVFIFAVLFSFLPGIYKKIFSVIFLVIYGIYVYRTFQHERASGGEGLRNLYFAGKKKIPDIRLVVMQDIVSLAGIVAGARFFVSSIEHISTAMNVSPFLFALFAAPIVTELPEKFNSIIWVGRKKDTLALGNISGAMVFQSSIVVFVGVVATEWVLNTQAIVSAAVTLASALSIIIYMKTTKKLHAFVLAGGVLFYLAYIAAILFWFK